MSTDSSDPPSIRALGRHLHANPGSVTRWLRKGMPTDLAAATAWRAQHVGQRVKPGQQKAAPASPSDGGTFTHWRTRREAAAAKQAELELALRCGQLVETDDVHRVLAGHLIAAKEIALGVGARLGPVLAAESDIRKCVDLIDDEMHRMLHEIRAAVEAFDKGAPDET